MNRIVCAPMRILMCLCMCLSCFAQGALAADEIATTIRDRYASLKSFQANFTQYLTHQESGQTEKREGELLFRRPFLVSWETKPPVAERLIITDKEIWDYIADENIAYRYPRELVEDSRSLIQVVTGQALLSKDFDVKDAGTEGKLRILQLYPKEPVPQLVEARLYVDPEKGYIQRAVITDFYGNASLPPRAWKWRTA